MLFFVKCVFITGRNLESETNILSFLIRVHRVKHFMVRKYLIEHNGPNIPKARMLPPENWAAYAGQSLGKPKEVSGVRRLAPTFTSTNIASHEHAALFHAINVDRHIAFLTNHK